MIHLEPTVVNGEHSSELVTVKLRRETLHPGVMGLFIEEKAKVLAYVRGQFFHAWVVTKADAEAFHKHLSSFDPKVLQAYFADLRKQFPKTGKQTDQATEKAADLMAEIQGVLSQEGAGGFGIDLQQFVVKEPTPPEAKKEDPEEGPGDVF
jgi:hypothetical protein